MESPVHDSFLEEEEEEGERDETPSALLISQIIEGFELRNKVVQLIAQIFHDFNSSQLEIQNLYGKIDHLLKNYLKKLSDFEWEFVMPKIEDLKGIRKEFLDQIELHYKCFHTWVLTGLILFLTNPYIYSRASKDINSVFEAFFAYMKSSRIEINPYFMTTVGHIIKGAVDDFEIHFSFPSLDEKFLVRKRKMSDSGKNDIIKHFLSIFNLEFFLGSSNGYESMDTLIHIIRHGKKSHKLTLIHNFPLHSSIKKYPVETFEFFENVLLFFVECVFSDVEVCKGENRVFRWFIRNFASLSILPRQLSLKVIGKVVQEMIELPNKNPLSIYHPRMREVKYEIVKLHSNFASQIFRQTCQLSTPQFVPGTFEGFDSLKSTDIHPVFKNLVVSEIFKSAKKEFLGLTKEDYPLERNENSITFSIAAMSKLFSCKDRTFSSALRTTTEPFEKLELFRNAVKFLCALKEIEEELVERFNEELKEIKSSRTIRVCLGKNEFLGGCLTFLSSLRRESSLQFELYILPMISFANAFFTTESLKEDDLYAHFVQFFLTTAFFPWRKQLTFSSALSSFFPSIEECEVYDRLLQCQIFRPIALANHLKLLWPLRASIPETSDLKALMECEMKNRSFQESTHFVILRLMQSGYGSIVVCEMETVLQYMNTSYKVFSLNRTRFFTFTKTLMSLPCLYVDENPRTCQRCDFFHHQMKISTEQLMSLQSFISDTYDLIFKSQNSMQFMMEPKGIYLFFDHLVSFAHHFGQVPLMYLAFMFNIVKTTSSLEILSRGFEALRDVLPELIGSKENILTKNLILNEAFKFLRGVQQMGKNNHLVFHLSRIFLLKGCEELEVRFIDVSLHAITSHTSFLFDGVVKNFITKLSQFYDNQPSELFNRHKEHFVKGLLGISYKVFYSSQDQTFNEGGFVKFMERLMPLGNFLKTKLFFINFNSYLVAEMLKHFLLIPAHNGIEGGDGRTFARLMLKGLSSWGNHRFPDPLSSAFPQIIAMMVNLKLNKRATRVLAHFLQSIGQQPFPVECQALISELLLSLSMDSERVLGLINYLLKSRYKNCGIQERGEGSAKRKMKDKAEPTYPITYIGMNIACRLLTFEAHLFNENDTYEEKKEILASLAVLIKILPTDAILENKVKLFSSFTSYGSLGSRFHFSLLLIWRWFIVRLEKEAMESLVVQICGVLLGLRRNHKIEVDALLSHIVMEKTEESNRSQLHFLENLVPNQDFPFVKEVKEAVESLRKKDWIQFLRLLLSQCTKESSPNIRLSALKKIKHFLQEECESIQRLVVRDQNVQSIIHLMIRRLLELNEFEGNDMRDLCAECLGLLGALDPFRFTVLAQRGCEGPNKIFSVESPRFQSRLLHELAQFFQKSEKRGDVERIGLVLQRLLRLLKSHGVEELFESLQKSSKDVLYPFLTSCYAKASGSSLSAKLDSQSVVYLSPAGSSFPSWISNWQRKLTRVVKRGFAKDLFGTLEALPGNYETALNLLPHLLMYALVDATSQEHEDIFNEISAVLAIVPQSPIVVKGELNSMTVLEQPLHVVERKDQAQGSSFKGQAMKIVFAIIDHLNASLRLHKAPNSQQNNPDVKAFSTDDIDLFALFLKKIPYQALANAAYECEAYARALMYFEQYLKEVGHLSEEMTPFAIRLFLNLNELDSVSGIIGRKGYTSPTSQSILINLANGQIEKTILMFDELMNEKEESLVIHQGIVQLYCAIGNTKMAQKCLKNVYATKRWENELDAVEMEIAKRDGDYKRLEQLVSRGNDLSSWSFSVSDTILNLRGRQFHLAKKGIVEARRKIMEGLAGSLFDYSSNTGGFEKIVRLHVLEELDEMRKLMGHLSNQSLSPCLKSYFLKKTMKNWEDRFHSMDHSLMVIQPILTTREVLLEILLDALQSSCPEFKHPAVEYIDSVQKQSWFFQIKQHCRLGNVNRAERMMKATQVEGRFAVNYFQEAKMFQRLGCKEKGREVLLSGFSAHFPDLVFATPFAPQNVIKEWRDFWGRYLLLTASLSFSLKTTDKDLNGQMFTAAAELDPCEKSFYALAKFYESTMKRGRMQITKDPSVNDWAESTEVLKLYANVLKSGTDYVYESLPKILNIWYQMGSQEDKISENLRQPYNKFLMDMSCAIGEVCRSLAPHILFTSFSLLLSRVVAKNKEIRNGVGEILQKVITAHPAQTLWLILHDINSENPERKKQIEKIIKSIIHKTSKPDANFKNLVNLYKFLGVEIQKLSFYKDSKGKKILILKECVPSLVKMIAEHPNAILLPYQEFLNPNLSHAVAGQLSHSPFSNAVYINGISPQAEVLPSLQKPKKIRFLGSNGKKYTSMCKGSDDLRRDLKMMEVIHVINWYLARGRESRQRNLRIRTFGVVPINAKCGLIEWVPNLESIRGILLRYYRESGTAMDPKEINKNTVAFEKPLSLKLEKFRYLVSRHPSVFDKWFLNNFTDPSSWIEARNTYIRTAAAMSIVGYVMGLGDRHGENILINTTNGEIVHVDYNCIFNKGELLSVPEVVPFRLTHNMVAGMGPFGKDGLFRKACETVLKVIRSKEDVLESVVATFKYDPLEEWRAESNYDRPISRTGTIASEAEENVRAIETLERVTMRMRGSERMMSKKVDLELAPEPLVDYLISEATNEEKLASMYIGWAPYM